MRLWGRWLEGLAGACLLLACTAPNPAFWRGPDDPAEEERTDAAVVVMPPRSDAAPLPAPEDTGTLPTDVGAPPADAAAADLATAAPDGPPPDQGPVGFVPPPGCGLATATVTGINNADGVVVDTDGTVYFLTDNATDSFVGRIEPGKMPQIKWLTVYGSPVTWGLALDSAIERLYVVVVSGAGALVAYDDIKSPAPRGSRPLEGLTNPNDAVVAADGTVYFSVQGDRHIHWMSRDGRTGVTTRNPLGNVSLKQAPSAVTIDPTGNLIVGLEHGGPLYRIVLNGTAELSSGVYGKWTGWANGLTFDRQGRLHIGIYDDVNPRDVVRLEADGMTTTKIASGSRFSSIAFGRGPLDCRDLYIADPYGPLRRVRIMDALE